MADIFPSAPQDWRNFTTKFPIGSCRLKREDLKKIYRIINDRQKEYRDRILATLNQQEGESESELSRRREYVAEYFVLSVTVSADSGEVLTGNREEIFDDSNFPGRIKNIFYSTQSVPEAILKHVPQDRIVMFLDFSAPPMFDMNRLPTFATQNESNFEISAINETWFSATKSRLSQFFEERKTGRGWLHRAGIYEVLLMFIGLPFAVWTCARLDSTFVGLGKLSAFPRTLVFCYAFLLSLVFFRFVFSYSRWVFPKVEIEASSSSRSPTHRYVLGALMLTLVGNVLWEAIKLIV